MTIQLILSLVFLFLFIYGFNQTSRYRLVGTFICVTAASGTLLAWFPEYATYVGNLMGVGRGADLILYLSVVASLVVGFSFYLKLNSHMMLLTQLTRHIALSSPRFPEGQVERTFRAKDAGL